MFWVLNREVNLKYLLSPAAGIKSKICVIQADVMYNFLEKIK